MKITIQAAAVFAAIFAVICFGTSIDLFNSLREITDTAAADDTRGFAWFWAFLGLVGAAIAAGSWWIVRDVKSGTPQ